VPAGREVNSLITLLPGALDGRPIAAVVAVLYLIATVRGQATYWLARALTEQALRHSDRRAEEGRSDRPDRWAGLRRWLQGEDVEAGVRSLRRWGLAAVPFCYLTVGFQTLVLAAAGVLRIPWRQFTVAQVPGALAWAAIYATIGIAAWEAMLAAVAGRPAAVLGVGAVVVVVVATRLSRRTRK
jgi:membrane protein DedA with SNARE-associated domain